MSVNQTSIGVVLSLEDATDGSIWQGSKNATWAGLHVEIVILDVENGVLTALMTSPTLVTGGSGYF